MATDDALALLAQCTTYEKDVRATNQNGFGYRQLEPDHIRLVCVMPGESGTDIRCEIQHHHLHTGLKFHALSYQWGSEPSNCTIFLNGCRIHVRKNLWRFLHQVRELSSLACEPFWIDALCIDQSNNEERTNQVKLIGSIYSLAQKVVAWLGPAHSNCVSAIRYLTESAAPWKQKKQFIRLWNRSLGRDIANLCERSYWTRLWIFQELILAQDVVLLCGAKTLPWNNLEAFLSNMINTAADSRLADNINYRHVQSSPAMSLIKLFKLDNGSKTLWNLMLGTRHLRCADKRDKVYALLGVAEGGHTGIEPNYDMPVNVLLNAVLKYHHLSSQPRSFEEVFHQCQQLADLLSESPDAMFALDGCDENHPRPHSADIADFPLALQGSAVSLWWASAYGHGAVQDMLFKNGIINDSTLLLASKLGNAKAVKILLNTVEFDHSIKDQNGSTPLHLAAEFGRAEALEVLLASRRCDLKKVNHKGRTPLHSAIISGDDISVMALLASEGIDVNVQDAECNAPLHLAVQHGREMAFLALIATKEIDVNVVNAAYRWTPLHLAVEYANETALNALLAAKSIKVNEQDISGRTPLNLAATRGNATASNALLAAKSIKVNAQNNLKRTALHEAIDSGNFVIANALLCSRDINPNLKDSVDQAPLHLAIIRGQEAIIAALLASRSIDINIENAQRRTPLHLAALLGQESTITALLAMRGVNINAQDNEENRPLHYVAVLEQRNIIDAMLACPGIELNAKNHVGLTPLHRAVGQKQNRFIEAALGVNGIDWNAKDKIGQTPLREAVRPGHEEVLKTVLLSNQVNLNKQDKHQWTALYYAVTEGSPAAVALLLGDPRIDSAFLTRTYPKSEARIRSGELSNS